MPDIVSQLSQRRDSEKSLIKSARSEGGKRSKKEKKRRKKEKQKKLEANNLLTLENVKSEVDGSPRSQRLSRRSSRRVSVRNQIRKAQKNAAREALEREI